jgi:hypothetical protein
MQIQPDEVRMLGKALQFYPLLAQRLSETDKAIVLEGAEALMHALRTSWSWAIHVVCHALTNPLTTSDTLVGKYVDKHIRPRLSNVPGAGESWAPPLPRIIQ